MYVVYDVSSNLNSKTNEFVARFYGRKLLDDSEKSERLSSTEEALICQANNLAGLGPKLYGVFEGGRVEEFVPSHQLREVDLVNNELVLQIARKLARYHSLRVPMRKKQRDILKVAETYYQRYSIDNFVKFAKLLDCDPSFMTDFDWKSEIAWLRESEPRIGGRLVTLHGDVNKNNILVRDEVDSFNERIMIIDYENSAIEYRGRDIGMFFAAKTIEVDDTHFRHCCEYPDDEWRRNFITEYLRQTKELDTIDFDDQGLDSIDHVMMESDFYMFYWIVFIFRFVIKQDESSFLLKMPKEFGLSWMVSV